MARINKKDDKIFDSYQKFTYKCKCGHSVVIINKTKKAICGWCGNYVYSDKKEEFKDKIKIALKKGSL